MEELKSFIGTEVARVVEPFHEKLREQAQEPVWLAKMLNALPGQVQRPVERYDIIGGLTRSLAAAKMDVDRAAGWAKKTWGDTAAMTTAVTKALAAGSATAGGFLVPGEVYNDVIELLRTATAIRRMNPMIIDMNTGVVSIPKITGGSTAAYIGENQDDNASTMTFGDVVLTWKKLRSLVPISNDLLRFSSPSADTIVRNDMVQALAIRQDLAFLRGDGLQHTPKGLRYWAPSANILLANATVNTANIVADLNRMILQLMNANVRMIRPGWIFANRTAQYLRTSLTSGGDLIWGREMNDTGTLLGIPFTTTNQVPITLGGGANESEIYLVDFADVIIGEAQSLLLDVSTEASYMDGGQMVSAFSRDQTVIRAIEEHDIGMRHDESIAILTGVTWGA
jgi:HK97 family phage major capsid protein